jgi:hypothetical protein
MTARTKLNRAFFNGSLLLAATAGALSGSWWIFGLTLASLLALNIASDEIRLHKRQR